MGGGAEKLVLEVIVKYACPEMKPCMLAKYDPNHQDVLRHAEQLIANAQHALGPPQR